MHPPPPPYPLVRPTAPSCCPHDPRSSAAAAPVQLVRHPGWQPGARHPTSCPRHLTRARIRGPFDGKIIPLKDNKTIILQGEDFCQLASNLRMAASLLITTSRRRALSTWRCVSGKASGRLKQDQTTRGEGQVSQTKQLDPATRRLPRQDTKTKLQCGLTDDDIRRDVPVVTHCSSFSPSFCAPPLVTIKGRGGQTL
jgi:hypothetical protein